ncbi:fucose operon FucU protein [Actinobacillus pleuropneumoniae]|nr:fucose operon FucU protein [Actinobacillus pleuropneumoniae]
MLKGIHPAISPELLKVLAEMGHGDELVLSDAHFPAHSIHSKVIRADGIGVATLLEGISALFEFDQYVEAPLAMMQAVPGDTLDPSVEERYLAAIKKSKRQHPESRASRTLCFLRSCENRLCGRDYRRVSEIRQHHHQKRGYAR